MKAVSKYKSIIQELNYIFANLEKEQISLALLQKEQVKVMHYANRIADQIKEELIGDGKKAEYKGRLETALFEFGLDPNLLHYYDTPEFDFATIYKDEATDVKACLGEMIKWANDMQKDVCSMLDKVSKFVGYTPEPQQGEMPKELMTPEARVYFEKAIELGLMDANNNWLKGWQMLACFAREMSLKLKLGKGERIAWKPFETLFCVPKGKLRLNYNDIQKTGQAPQEVYLIDKVFE